MWPIEYRLHAKLERADKHLKELQNVWAQFRDHGGYRVGFKDDPQTGDRTHYVEIAGESSPEISVIAGDAIHNLRSVLDHLAHHLVVIGTGKPGPFRSIYFPVGEDFADFEVRIGAKPPKGKSKAKGIIKRLRNDAVKAIYDIEPYEGGKGAALWHLQCLNNIDKHRLLITFGSVNSQSSMLPSERASLRRNFLGMVDIDPALDKIAFMSSSPAMFPLEPGTVLRVTPKAEVEDDPYFPIDIAFGEPEVIKGKPVLTTLYQTFGAIHDIVHNFEDSGLLR
jgi:hypothetical protein